MVRGLYVGSFDPITLGHLDVIERASRFLDELIVAVGNHPRKSMAFPVPERLELIEDACHHLDNVEAASFDGLAVAFAQERQASVLVRGLRTEADYVYEMQMAMMNRTLDQQIETIFIPTRQDLSHVSSSLVKEVAGLGAAIDRLVPELAASRVQRLDPKGHP